MAGTSLGILGGTFDPIHIGHLRMAEHVFNSMELERIIFIPAYVPPHKLGQDFAPAEDRYAMTELAVAGNPHFTVSDMELKRTGVSYTIDTIRQLHAQYGDRELNFIIGADSVAQLHTWHNIEEMLELTRFVAVWRPGYEGAMEEMVRHLGQRARERVLLLDTPVYDISSTEIRTRIRQGASLAGLVPPAVEKYIYEHSLYGCLTGDKK
ncbi:MAG: nicotinate-nucleotide adenylyltransferase [Phascolarctobacterium sp.]